MKTNLSNLCYSYDFEKLFKKKGYAYFTNGDYNLNIIGVRSDQNRKVTNAYDDYLVLIYKTNGNWTRQVYNITTEPGLTYMKNPSNSKGTAILAPGQYRGAYSVDLHRGKYKALCQRNKAVKVYRDGNKDSMYDLVPEKLDTGMFGINIHRSSEYAVTKNINNYSAGCQVFSDPNQFKSFMNLVNKSKDIFGNSFTYTLIDEKDMV